MFVAVLIKAIAEKRIGYPQLCNPILSAQGYDLVHIEFHKPYRA